MLTGILGALSLAAFLVAPLASQPPQSDGGLESLYRNTGTGIDVHGKSTTPGKRHGSSGDLPKGQSGQTTTIGHAPPPDKPSPFENCLVDWDSNRGCWQNSIPGEEAEPEKGEESPGLPPITITDLATFSPAEGRIVGEPDSLGVVGLPANFVTEAAPHVRSGDLFGFPVDVRFTPVSYTFDYGDGETRTSSSPGASWASLGQAQFTPTDTSHTYSERGTYDARVDIAYAAEIDLGAGWFPVEGQLDIPGPTQQIRIFEAHTALVARTCAEQPTAPGC